MSVAPVQLAQVENARLALLNLLKASQEKCRDKRRTVRLQEAVLSLESCQLVPAVAITAMMLNFWNPTLRKMQQAVTQSQRHSVEQAYARWFRALKSTMPPK